MFLSIRFASSERRISILNLCVPNFLFVSGGSDYIKGLNGLTPMSVSNIFQQKPIPIALLVIIIWRTWRLLITLQQNDSELCLYAFITLFNMDRANNVVQLP